MIKIENHKELYDSVQQWLKSLPKDYFPEDYGSEKNGWKISGSKSVHRLGKEKFSDRLPCIIHYFNEEKEDGYFIHIDKNRYVILFSKNYHSYWHDAEKLMFGYIDSTKSYHCYRPTIVKWLEDMNLTARDVFENENVFNLFKLKFL